VEFISFPSHALLTLGSIFCILLKKSLPAIVQKNIKWQDKLTKNSGVKKWNDKGSKNEMHKMQVAVFCRFSQRCGVKMHGKAKQNRTEEIRNKKHRKRSRHNGVT